MPVESSEAEASAGRRVTSRLEPRTKLRWGGLRPAYSLFFATGEHSPVPARLLAKPATPKGRHKAAWEVGIRAYLWKFGSL